MPVSQEQLQGILDHWALGDSTAPLGYIWAADVRTTANITLSGSQTIDATLVTDGMVVLVMNQSTGAENGVYRVGRSAWTRMDNGLSGQPTLRSKAYCWVSGGATWINTLYSVTTSDPITVGTTSITWGAVSSGGGTGDHKVLQSVTDTTAAYLGAKLHAGTNITLTVLNPGANESIDIAAAAASSDHKLSISGTDTTNDYLDPKLTVTAPVTKAIVGGGGAETLNLSVPNFVAGPSHAAGLVPDPGAGGGTTKFLREDVSWQTAVTSVATSAPLAGGPITTTGTITISDFVASGVGHARGTVPDPGGVSGATKFLREDATWAVPPGAPTTGVTTVDFGAFSATAPATMATATVAAPGITTSSIVRAWITPYSGTGTEGTADHSADEHIIGASLIDIVIGAIDAAGATFTIYAICRDMGGSPLAPPGIGRRHVANATAGRNYTQTPTVVGSVGGTTINTMWGAFNVAYSWS